MSVSTAFLQVSASWIFMPDTVIISLSQDGKRFHSINEIRNDIPKKNRPASYQAVLTRFPEDKGSLYQGQGSKSGRLSPLA
jgi:hypothetical protein